MAASWKDSEEVRAEAEALWRPVRIWNAEGDVVVGDALAEVRKMLDEVVKRDVC
jgi:hypothetical protein